MKQSRLMSWLESLINIAVGFGISLAAQMFFLPLLGVAIDFHQNLFFALIMTVISLLRSFILRRIFEALHIRRPLSPSLLAIAAERFRQIDAEGWTPEHDDEHASGVMARAGACYAMMPAFRRTGAYSINPNMAGMWPWDRTWWKPADDRRDLVRAGALIVAELDKQDRNRKVGQDWVHGCADCGEPS